jgi:hypothetical protein
MVAEPAATPVALPPASTVATAVSEDVQAESAVTLAVLASLYVAVAVNWRIEPACTVVLAADTEIELRVFVGAVIWRLAEPVMPWDVAVMVAEPAATPVTLPLASTVATVVSADVQATTDVTSAVLPSLYEAVAVNWRVAPACRVALDGDTAMEASVLVAAVTVRLTELLTPCKVAVMVTVPAAMPVAFPLESTVAMEGSVEVQAACDVMSAVLPSL